MSSAVVELVRVVLFAMAHVLPGGIGSAILVFSLIVRVALLPATLRAARRQRRVAEALEAMKPALAALRAKHGGDPRRLRDETLVLYREKGVGAFDRGTVTLWLVQLPTVGALLAAVRGGLANGARFLWMPDLARPDVLLASAVVAVATASATLSAKAGGNPSLRAVIAVGAASAILSLVWLLRSSAAFGLYWGASSVVGVAQAIILQRERRRNND